MCSIKTILLLEKAIKVLCVYITEIILAAQPQEMKGE